MSRATVRRYRAIKRKIRAYRLKRRWSYADLGHAVGLTRGAAFLLERSDSRVSLDALFRLADQANVSVASFLP